MLELTLVRHAPTMLNEQRRYQGWTDPPLSERGRLEARRLGERLGAVSFDVLLHSDSRRCVETAACAFPGRPSTSDPRWREMDFGAWDGRTYEECEARDPERLRAWIDDPAHTTPPGGESFDDFRQRVDEATAALPRAGCALLIAHGGPIRRLLAAALGLEWRQVVLMQLSACGITRLALHPGGGHLLCLNDTAHLEEERGSARRQPLSGTILSPAAPHAARSGSPPAPGSGSGSEARSALSRDREGGAGGEDPAGRGRP